MSERRCLVAICHNGPTIFTRTAQSLMEIGWGNRVQDAKDAHGFAAIDFAWEASLPRVDSLRDAIAWQAQQHPAGYTHLLFLDADMVWPTDVLVQMLRYHAHGIVSAHYCLKAGSYNPVAMLNGRLVDGGHTTHYDYDLDFNAEDGRTDLDGLRDVEVVGMGCTLVPMAVFRALMRPWFHYEDDDKGWPRVSEDVPFCRKARAAGFRVAWNPSIHCGHVTTHTVTEQWHKAVTHDHPMALLTAVAEGMR